MVQTSSGRRGASRGGWPRRRSTASSRRRRHAPGPDAALAARTTVAPDGSVALSRLLEIARLTPAQAVALGSDVLTGFEERHGAGTARRGLRRTTVRVAVDGGAHLIDDPPGGPHVPGADRADLAVAASLLDDLAAAARPPAVTVGGAAGLPASGALGALDRAASEARLPGVAATTVASILRDADATGGAQARTELARLVRAASGGGVAAPQPARAAAHPVAPHQRRPRRRSRTVARAVVARTWKWVLSIVVLAAVILLEVALLRDDITRDIDAVLEAGRSGTVASAGTAAALPPVVPPAPAAAGTITSIGLRAVQPCEPGASCAIRTQVVLQPQAEPQTLTWTFQIVDRCTGAAVSAPGGTVTVAADGGRADVVSTVALPPGEALAVLAVTGGPSTAASAPLLVPAQGTCGGPAVPSG